MFQKIKNKKIIIKNKINNILEAADYMASK